MNENLNYVPLYYITKLTRTDLQPYDLNKVKNIKKIEASVNRQNGIQFFPEVKRYNAGCRISIFYTLEKEDDEIVTDSIDILSIKTIDMSKERFKFSAEKLITDLKDHVDGHLVNGIRVIENFIYNDRDKEKTTIELTIEYLNGSSDTSDTLAKFEFRLRPLHIPSAVDLTKDFNISEESMKKLKDAIEDDNKDYQDEFGSTKEQWLDTDDGEWDNDWEDDDDDEEFDWSNSTTNKCFNPNQDECEEDTELYEVSVLKSLLKDIRFFDKLATRAEYLARKRTIKKMLKKRSGVDADYFYLSGINTLLPQTVYDVIKSIETNLDTIMDLDTFDDDIDTKPHNRSIETFQFWHVYQWVWCVKFLVEDFCTGKDHSLKSFRKKVAIKMPVTAYATTALEAKLYKLKGKDVSVSGRTKTKDKTGQDL